MGGAARNQQWLLIPLLGAVLAFWAGSAAAQEFVGPFEPFNSWWAHPTQGFLGVTTDGSQIEIDRDFDGLVDSSFAMPPGLPVDGPNLRLTPSQDVLYAFGGTCQSGTGTLVHFYRIPDTGSRLAPILTGLCIQKGIVGVPGFYDTGLCEPTPTAGLDCPGRLGVSPQRIAYFVTPGPDSSVFHLVWVDFERGTSTIPTGFDFRTARGYINASPAGTKALVQHDLSVPLQTDYTLVDLCPGSLGRVLNPGGLPISDDPGDPVPSPLHALVTAASAGMFTLQVRTQSGLVRTEDDLPDCLAGSGACCFPGGCTPDTIQSSCTGPESLWLGDGSTCDECPVPPVTEACCFGDGAFPICEQLEAGECTSRHGSPQGAGSTCSSVSCPVPDPTISASGPATARPGDEIVYTGTYSNDGGLPATDVEIQADIPSGSEFVSASAGGDASGVTVRWALGELSPGASGSVSFTVRVGCDGNLFSNGFLLGYQFGGLHFVGSGVLTTPVDLLPAAGIGVSVTTTPDATPLGAGDLQTHAIVLTNTLAETRTDLFLAATGAPQTPGIRYGDAVGFDSLVSAGGGTVDTAGGRFEWTGSLGPSASTTIEFRTRVDDCIPAGTDETRLNAGSAIAVFDLCDTEVGTAPAAAGVPLQQTVLASLAATNLDPAKVFQAPAVSFAAQLTRPGSPVTVQLTLASGTGATIPSASASLSLAGLALPAVPFVPPTDPGASFDPGTGEVSWAGTLPATGFVTITLAGDLAACRAELELGGSTGTGCQNIRARSILAGVPEPPAGPYVAALGTAPAPFDPGGFGSVEDQIFRVDPDPAAVAPLETQLCLPTEFSTAIGSAPNGDIWAGWLPTYRYNPITLDFQPFDFRRLDLTELSDIAVDPSSGVVYFVGSRAEGVTTRAAIRRYDPGTDQLTALIDEPTLAYFDSAAVDATGAIAASARPQGIAAQELVQVEPSPPASLRVYSDPGVGSPGPVSIDADGDYVVMDSLGTPGGQGLAEVDPASGNASLLVPNLGTLFPGTFGFGSMVADSAGDVWVAPVGQAGLAVVRRTPAIVGEVVIPFRFGAEGVLQNLALAMGPSSPPPDTDGDGVPDSTEDAAPHGGDGNNDGAPDRGQPEVASLPNAEDGSYITLVAPAGTTLRDVVAEPTPGEALSFCQDDPLRSCTLDSDCARLSCGLSLPLGLLGFRLTGLAPGASTRVEMHLEPGVPPFTTYYKFDALLPTPFSEFLLDQPLGETTGAEFPPALPDRIVLHLEDGGRGDQDGRVDGEILEPGGPGLVPEPATPAGLLGAGVILAYLFRRTPPRTR